MKASRFATVLLAAFVLAAGCGKTKSSSGSNSNWLTPCSTDAECGADLTCLCGVCTVTCNTDGECGGLDERATCARAAACSPGASASACVLSCMNDSECRAGLTCNDNLCARYGSSGGSSGGNSGGSSGGSGSDAGPEEGGARHTGGAENSAGGGVELGGADTDAGGAGALAGAAGSSGSGAIVEPYFRAGTRLKPRVYTAGELEVLDTTSEQSWFDVETGVWCRFRVGPDGIERCFPSHVFLEDPLTPVLTFSDAACTRRAVRAYDENCGATSRYVVFESESVCGLQPYRISAKLPADTPLYERRDGMCTRAEPATDQTPVLLLEEAPVETFVAVQRVSRPRHPDMDAFVREGEDGSSEIVGFSEPGKESSCYGLRLDMAPPRCVPSWRPIMQAFSDAACEDSVGMDQRPPHCTSRTSSALLGVSPDAGMCGRPPAITGLWESEGESSTPIFLSSDGVCTDRSMGETVKVQVLGAPIEWSSLPLLDLIEVGEGPLKLPFYGYGGIPYLPAPFNFAVRSHAGPFSVAATGEECEPQLFEDGSWRCVPTSFRATTELDIYFESEECTGQLSFPRSESAACIAGVQSKGRGVVLQALGAVECFAFPVVGIYEFGGAASPRSELWSTCRPLPAGAQIDALELNAVGSLDIFPPMGRQLKD